MNVALFIRSIVYLLLLYILQTNAFSQTKPNIIWITVEDISPDLSFYGDFTAKTPNLNALAKESQIFDNAFAVVGVCGPSRSAIITGMYPTSIGTMHMRTGKDITSWGGANYNKDINITDMLGSPIIEYSCVIPENIKCFTQYLREAGYYCTNNAKTDYQFASPLAAWDENDSNASWKNRKIGQPFFSIINLNETHESKLFPNAVKTDLTIDKSKVQVPPYLIDSDSMRWTIARHYSNIEIMDVEVGKIIKQLKNENLYDESYIFFFSDHGGPLPREKREVYDSGTKIPLLIKYPRSIIKGRNAQLISTIDLAPTILSLAGIPIPKHLQGKPLNRNQTNENTYVFASGDRFDEHTDRVRAIRTSQYLYIKNFFPNQTGYKDVNYRKSISGMNEMIRLHKENKLNKTQAQWFNIKPEEELFDVVNDPYQINNLATNPNYKKQLKQLRKTLIKHLKKYGDLGSIPESNLIQSMWPNFSQPLTKAPIVKVKNNQISATTSEKGVVISYLITDKPISSFDKNLDWQIYSKPLIKTDKHYYFVAERIGWKVSNMVEN